jgi:hypothetical protein
MADEQAAGVVVPQAVAQLGYQQLEMRKKIALQMMAQRHGYPKNLGQGLASLGNSMGQIGMMQMLAQQQAAQDADRRRMLELQEAQEPQPAVPVGG